MPRRDAGIVVFTRDLRVHDNPALAAALDEHETVVPVFVLDGRILSGPLAAPNRLAILGECLDDLDAALSERGCRLVLRRGDWVAEVTRLVTETRSAAVHVAADHSGYAVSRLRALEARVGALGVPVHRYPGVAVVDPGEVLPTGGDHYAVFTPYHRRWLDHPWRTPLPAPGTIAGATAASDPTARSALSVASSAAVPARSRGGETVARAQMARWLGDGVAAYPERHDDLAADATSRLSAALHFGCLSPLELAVTARDLGAAEYVRQLCWRDFHLQVLAARPRAAWSDLRPARVRWRSDAAGLEAWRTAHTGYPVVDAAMRQLLAEGFVHNRARMVAASFLTKDLGIDWREGARHFLAHLVDGDIANNNLNWQWVAGTGYDTNAHRVFNPTLQGRRFDPAGVYIRRWVTELATIDGDIHDPAPEQRAAVGYPEPVVDHRVAVRSYRSARG